MGQLADLLIDLYLCEYKKILVIVPVFFFDKQSLPFYE